eukprot:9368132-Ditylum_brightwellii.AAC.1
MARKPKTPAEAGTILRKADPKDKVDNKRHTYFRSRTGKLLHMVRWSRSKMQNAVCELTMQGSAPTEAHMKALHHAMSYSVETPKRRWKLKSERTWDGKDKTFKFR